MSEFAAAANIPKASREVARQQYGQSLNEQRKRSLVWIAEAVPIIRVALNAQYVELNQHVVSCSVQDVSRARQLRRMRKEIVRQEVGRGWLLQQHIGLVVEDEAQRQRRLVQGIVLADDDRIVGYKTPMDAKSLWQGEIQIWSTERYNEIMVLEPQNTQIPAQRVGNMFPPELTTRRSPVSRRTIRLTPAFRSRISLIIFYYHYKQYTSIFLPQHF